ncbi:disulfide bond formation protein B [Pseudomonas sp. L7]|uniref:disulfide bond formation protein B n=1 Tax=Pseudomonas sp. L7 TaxID=3388343 RepID=UPI001647D0BB|nr:disulfide bond formation protein B [uncultured Pseudomonas sp.]
MSQARSRPLFFAAFLVSLATLGGAIVLENWLGLVPCPLCLTQRLLLVCYALVCLCAMLHAPGAAGTRVYAWLAGGCSSAGVALASRQVWLQGEWLAITPEPFAQTLQRSWTQALERLLVGSSECVSISWSFLDLTLPEWSLMAFLLLTALPLYCLLAYRFRNPGGS